jgi:hypothetical protein
MLNLRSQVRKQRQRKKRLKDLPKKKRSKLSLLHRQKVESLAHPLPRPQLPLTRRRKKRLKRRLKKKLLPRKRLRSWLYLALVARS